MRTLHYRDFCGVTATITELRDGTATLKVSMNGLLSDRNPRLRSKKYKNLKTAQNTWYRLCN